MEFIKKILSTIYSSENGMLYFYIITSILALFLIVLIIIAIKKDKSNLKIKVEDNSNKIDPNALNNDDKDKEEEIPKIKEDKTAISNDEFIKRLNTLKNKWNTR